MSDMDQSDRDKISVPLRPFTKGIVRDVSSTMIPAGALFDANGYIPKTSGLIRRGGIIPITTIDPPAVSRYDYVDSFINDDGTKTTYAIADGKFFELSGATFIERPCTYQSSDESPSATISATAGTTLIVGDGTNFLTNNIQVGDILIVDPTGTPIYYTVDTPSSDINLTVLEQIVVAIPAGTEFIIQRQLSAAPEWEITVQRIDRLLYICTGTRPLMCYNIDDPSRVTILDGARPFIPKTIRVFNDRLWCGNIFIPFEMADPIPSRWYTNRVSWSQILPDAGYTPTTAGAVDIDPLRHFNDLVEVGGEISALVILGSYLTVFFEFGIQYGRQTQVPGDILPLAFDTIPSGTRGVLQPGAVTVTKNGLIFVSTDNVYYLGENRQVVSISAPVSILIFRAEILNTRYKVHNFTESDGVVIGCGFNEDTYDEFWVFNLKTKAWTRFNYTCAYFNIFTIGSRLTYSDYPDGQIYGVEPPGQNDDALGNILPTSPALGTLVPIQPADPNVPPPPVDLPQYELTGYTVATAIYGGEGATQTDDRFYVTVGPYILVMDNTSSVDQNDAPVPGLLETGDFDFGRPDQNKTVYRLAMRLYAFAAQDITYHIQGSLDSGEEWWDLGDLTIFSGGKEGKCNFQFTGSAPRFRLISTSANPSYELVEVTLEVKGRGKQFSDT